MTYQREILSPQRLNLWLGSSLLAPRLVLRAVLKVQKHLFQPSRRVAVFFYEDCGLIVRHRLQVIHHILYTKITNLHRPAPYRVLQLDALSDAGTNSV